MTDARSVSGAVICHSLPDFLSVVRSPLAALTVSSHNDVIVRAAVDGLVERKSSKGVEQLAELLSKPQPAERRANYITALARLKPEDPTYQELLRKLLSSDRGNVRRAVIDAIVAAAGRAATRAAAGR